MAINGTNISFLQKKLKTGVIKTKRTAHKPLVSPVLENVGTLLDPHFDKMPNRLNWSRLEDQQQVV